MIVRRLPITILEILIVITIMGLVAGVVGINIRKALREQQYRSELSQFLDQVRLAQDLMLILDADIHLKIKAGGSSAIEYWLEADRPLPGNWDREIKRPPKLLKAVYHVSFPEAHQGVIDLKFLSGGSVMSKGPLQFATTSRDFEHDALVRYINLSGYPRPIILETSEAKGDEKKASFDTELTRLAVNEIQMLEQPESQNDNNPQPD